MEERKVKSKETSFLIVGAGTIGLSTALHLTERGYTNITVIDKDRVPSQYSAGNDLNKIVRADYEDHFYAKHALEAIQAWSSPFWRSCYHQTGYAVTISAKSPQKASTHMQRVIASITTNPSFPKDSLSLAPDADSIRELVPQLTGPLPGWTGYFNKHAGYARARLAMETAYDQLLQRGTRFEFGERGEAVSVSHIPSSEPPQIQTRSGTIYTADRIIMALGASTPRLLLSATPQLTAKSWAVGHIQLTHEEAERMEGMAVVNCSDLGFFFEPDPDTRLLKLCAHGGGYTNYEPVESQGLPRGVREVSLPPPANNVALSVGIPVEDEQLLRQLLAEALPQFQDRPLIRTFMCWCSDTRDSEYIIDYVPGSNNLVLAGGDSGHAFKMFPIFGGWVVDLLECGEQATARWRWKEIDRSGPAQVDWRVGSVKDIKEACRIDPTNR